MSRPAPTPTRCANPDRLLVITPPHPCEPSLAIAAARAGAIGLLDLGFVEDQSIRTAAMEKLRRLARNSSSYGVAYNFLQQSPRSLRLLRELAERPWPWLLIADVDFRNQDPAKLLEQVKPLAQRVIIEVYSVADALAAQGAGFDGIVVKGRESGGRVGEQSTFILLQRLCGRLRIPYWACGGISPNTAAAAVASGARGVVLREQLWLTEESSLAEEQRGGLRQLDGRETVLVGDARGGYRFFDRCGRSALKFLGERRRTGGPWLSAMRRVLRKPDPDASERLTALGADVGLAERLASRFISVSGILTEYRRAMEENAPLARRQRALAEGSALAAAHGVALPIVQGPMSRVSDVTAFGDAVSLNGALPCFALGLSRKAEAERMLEEAGKRLGDRPWGVGLLGFAPAELRNEQLEVLRRLRPAAAVVAGGRPSQAAELESFGVSTYLHAPTPNLLEMFLREGARKFVLEGRECGGHVGPLSSFALWGSSIEVLLAADVKDPAEIHVLLAGGIHDRQSAAMVAAAAAPLVQRGIKVGVLIGTAYLFTQEAVATGAITAEFQRQAVACRGTTLLESGLGHASRCAVTPFADQFNARRTELLAARTDPDKMRWDLESLNLGRLRLAAKGLKRRQANASRDDRLVEAAPEEQRRDGMFMIGEAATMIDQPRTMADLHHDICGGGVELLDELAGPSSSPARPVRRDAPGEPIAIVGMGCIFPQSEDPAEFWRNILARFDAVTQTPSERWNTNVFYSENRLEADRVYSKWGAFLGDVRFDPFKYRVPPATLRRIEPVQLLSLEVAWRALNDAGWLDRGFPRDRTAVIFGVSGPHEMGMAYGVRTMLRHHLARADELPQEVRDAVLSSLESRLPTWNEDSFPGFLQNVIAGRIANYLDLGGPNFVVDAACASSLAAVHTAVQQLRSRACDAALAGGADATNNPCGFMSFSATQALSPRGVSAPLDESADGIVLGEGVAAVVLKRLSDAERDGDRVYAVLRGIGAGSDGRNRSLTAPHAPGQLETLHRAYRDAGLSPAQISLIEAHGTGTVAGDRAEVEALQELFRQDEAPPRSCAIGSVKSMIGHTKSTAGMAGLIKAALSLRHKILPPTIHVDKPNEKFDSDRGPLYINTETRPWIRNDPQQPRRAGVSAFGFGGANFHAVLEEYTGDYHAGQRIDMGPRPAEVFFFAAPDRRRLAAAIRKLDQQLEQAAPADPAQLAYSLLRDNKLRAAGPAKARSRLAIVASDTADLRRKMAAALRQLGESGRFTQPSGIYCDESEETGDRRVAFLIPGQGAQRVNMLRDLAALHGDGVAVFERADRVLASCLDRPLSSYIYPTPVFDEAQRALQQEELNNTRIAQPALAAAGLFALDLLRRFGIRPDMAAGHSHGEYVALHAAGCLSEDELLLLSARRGEVVRSVCQEDPGAMAAVLASPEAVETALKELDIPARISNFNAPDNTIVAGPVAAIERVVQELPDRKLRVRRIPVTAAFHTPAVQPAADQLAAALRDVRFAEPAVPVYSNVTAEPYPGDAAAIRELLTSHLVRPVRFVEQVRRMYEAGARVFIEAGPGATISKFVSRILRGKPHWTIPLDMPGRQGALQLAHLLAQCAALGIDVRLDQWFAGRRLQPASTSDYLTDARLQHEAKAKAWIVNARQARPPDSTNAPKPIRNERKPSRSDSRSKSPAGAAEPRDRLSIDAHRNQQSRGSQSMNDLVLPPPNGARKPAKESTLFRPANGDSKVISSTLPDTSSRSVNGNGRTAALPAAEPPARPAACEADQRGPRSTQPANEIFARIDANMAGWLAWQRQQQEVTSQFLQLQQQYFRLLADGAVASPLCDPAANGRPPAPIDAAPVSPTAAPTTARPLEAVLAAPTTSRSRPSPAPVATGRNLAPPASEEFVRQRPAIAVSPRPATADRSSEAPRPARPPAAAEDSAVAAKPEADQRSEAASRDDAAVRVPTTEEFRSDLLETTSQRTGYPVDMLEENLLLEADLGIDSIKRIEIFNNLKKYYAFTQYKQRSEEEILNTFTSLKTLGDIVEAFDRERTEYLTRSEAGAAETIAASDAVKGANDADRKEPPRPFEPAVPVATVKGREVPAPEPVSEVREEEEDLLERYSVRVRRSVLPEGAARRPKMADGRILLVLGETPPGWDPHWAAALVEHGRLVRQAIPASRAEKLADGRFAADFQSEASVAELHRLLLGANVRVGGIVNLLALGQRFRRPGISQDDCAEQLMQSLLNVARQFDQELLETSRDAGGRASGAQLINATSLGGAFGIGVQGPLPLAQAASLGVVKSLAREWPHVTTKTIDLDPTADPPSQQAMFAAEILAGDQPLEVGLTGRGRTTLELAAEPLGPEDLGPLPLDARSVVLITGGARGVTAEIAKEIARRCRCRLILMGRTPEPADEDPELQAYRDEKSLRSHLIARRAADERPIRSAEINQRTQGILKGREVRENLAAIRAAGADVEYHAVDVQDAAAFAEVIDHVYRRHGKIDGVIHGAGVIADSWIRNKTAESASRVFRTKAASANVLAGKLKPESLKFFFLFSSVAARFGNIGQTDYAAANEYLNKLARQLDAQWPGRVAAVNWGPWDRGMMPKHLAEKFNAAGVPVIPTHRGVAALLRELRAVGRQDPEIVIACHVNRLEKLANGAK